MGFDAIKGTTQEKLDDALRKSGEAAPAAPKAKSMTNHPDFDALPDAKKQRYLKGGYDPVTPGKDGQELLDIMHGR